MKCRFPVVVAFAVMFVPTNVRAQAASPVPPREVQEVGAGNNGSWWRAVTAGDVALAAKALESDAALLTAPDAQGAAPLIVAVVEGHLPLAEFLVGHGADVNVRDGRGQSVLGRAVRAGRIEMVKFLLERGADVTARTRNGSSVLHDAGSTELARLLVEAGAPVDVANADGATPLHHAVFRGRDDVARFLVQQGANVNALTTRGIAPLHLATTFQRVSAVGILLEAGADVHAIDRFDGNSAYGHARGIGSREMEALLVSHGARDDLPAASGPPWKPGVALPEAGTYRAFVLAGRLFVYRPGEGRSAAPGPATRVGTLHEFDRNGQRWVERAAPPDRQGVATAVLGDRLYLFGGRSGDGEPVSAVDEYDPQADRWSARAPMPTARRDPVGVVVHDAIYLIRGSVGADPGAGTLAVEAYDPRADQWSHRAPAPSACGFPVVVDRTVYLIGGHEEKTGWTSAVKVYDTESDRWTVKPDTPVPPWTLGAYAVDGRIIVICMQRNTVLEYRPDTDTWTRKAPMPISRSDFEGTVVDGKIIIAGGHFGTPAVTHSVECYDPARDVWRELQGLSQSRWSAALVRHDGRLFLMGGRVTGVDGPRPTPVTASVETYDVGALAE